MLRHLNRPGGAEVGLDTVLDALPPNWTLAALLPFVKRASGRLEKEGREAALGRALAEAQEMAIRRHLGEIKGTALWLKDSA